MWEKNSWTFYQEFLKNVNRPGGKAGFNQIMQLLKSMKEELQYDGTSPLYSAAILVWSEVCGVYGAFPSSTEAVQIDTNQPRGKMQPFDANFFLNVLPLYISGKDVGPELRKALPYLGKNYTDNPTSMNIPEARLEQINVALAHLRRKMGKTRREPAETRMPSGNIPIQGPGKPAVTSTVPASPQKEAAGGAPAAPEAAEGRKAEDASQRAQKIREEAKRQAQEILDRANRQAQETLDQANRQAQEILDQAQKQAEAKKNQAQETVQKLLHSARDNQIQANAADPEQELAMVRQSLLEVNDRMRKIESSLRQNTALNTCRNLLELYNLIADARDSCQKDLTPFDTRGSQMVNNLEEFLAMISEYLEDEGVQTLSTPAGSRLNVRMHEVVNAFTTYDPRKAVVRQSVRKGFCMGEQVIQKERVMIQ